jgi:hypothetical protein
VHGLEVAFLAHTERTKGLPLSHPYSVDVLSPARVVRPTDVQQELARTVGYAGRGPHAAGPARTATPTVTYA